MSPADHNTLLSNGDGMFLTASFDSHPLNTIQTHNFYLDHFQVFCIKVKETRIWQDLYLSSLSEFHNMLLLLFYFLMAFIISRKKKIYTASGELIRDI